jgi:hypothetical protein
MKKVIVFAAICLLVVLFFYLLKPDTFPPDLSNCTHIEIKYYPSSLDYFLSDNHMYALNVLSTDEKAYIKSFKTFTIVDPKLIKTFSDYLLKGTCTGRMEGRIPYATPVYINCYHNKKLITSLIVFGHKIVVDENRIFGNYEQILDTIEPNELTPFRLRGDCVYNLVRIYDNIFSQAKETKSYPEPEQWCDTTVKELQARWLDKGDILKVFQCPGVSEGKCHYAMNPNCEPHSLGDMVLLFETKAGWNQHGGAELFTFDNHEPRGGCVLLNDGTVKFIRTQKELDNLRWK